MSKGYAIQAVLRLPWNKSSLLPILERGNQLGVVYRHGSEDAKDYDIFRHTSAAEGADILLSTDAEVIYSGGPILHAQIEEVLFWISAQEKDGDTMYFSLVVGFSRERNFYASGTTAYYVNFDRYIRLLLKWCNGICIESLCTSEF